jgi:serine phosphatase RsbU (regulator of sigma subunit)/anti-anti-sigma regulatory factor
VASSDPPPEPLRPSVLVVDDDEDFRKLLSLLLRDDERRIDLASDAAEARVRLAERAYDVVITDLSMPGEGGLSLMQWSQEHCPGPAWIVLTGYGTMDTAVKALQFGAFDFLAKPLAAHEPLQKAVRNALEHQRLKRERDRLLGELAESNAQLHSHLEELEQAYRLLRQRDDDLRADLHRAGIIQRALLPHAPPRLESFCVHALYRPSHSIGGDLYDVVRLDERNVALLIADAAGHGLAAAMLAVLFRSRLPFRDPDSGEPRRPGELLRAANDALCRAFPVPSLFLTAAYCLLDTETRSLCVASAGHPPLLLLRELGGVTQLESTGPALGLYPDRDYAELSLELDPGDRVLFYSDGLYDWLPGGATSASATIGAALAREGATLADLAKAAPGDESPEDDVTLLLLEARPGESQFDNGTLRPLPAPAPAGIEFEILCGSDATRTHFAIQGRANWARSAALHAECVAAIEAGRDVLFDLGRCQNLDSTLLGTLHELCERAAQAGVELRLQCVPPEVARLFDELGLATVQERVSGEKVALPEALRPLADPDDPAARNERMLRAHQILASLNERNRREFEPLVALLERELDVDSG